MVTTPPSPSAAAAVAAVDGLRRWIFRRCSTSSWSLQKVSRRRRGVPVFLPLQYTPAHTSVPTPWNRGVPVVGRVGRRRWKSVRRRRTGARRRSRRDSRRRRRRRPPPTLHRNLHITASSLRHEKHANSRRKFHNSASLRVFFLNSWEGTPGRDIKKVKVAHTRLPNVRRVPELIPVLGSQPAGDVSYKPGGRLQLLLVRPTVTLATLKRVATNFAAW